MKIVMATGGSGGHIFPALKVANELKQRGHDLVFVGSFFTKEEKNLPNDFWMARIKKDGFSLENLDSIGLSRKNIFQSFLWMFLMLRAVLFCLRFLKRNQMEAVIGFGGYGSFPAVCAARLLKIPTMIHEQNVIPGKANIFLSQFVNKIAISFEETRKYFHGRRNKKVVITGCPCNGSGGRANREQVLKSFGLKQKFTIFVLGGSQGSHRVNTFFVQCATELSKEIDFQVIHVCGKKDYSFLKEEYQKQGIPFTLFEFLDKIEDAYSVSDLIISRAGAVTIFEIAAFAIPAILIPYPFAQVHP